MVRVTKKFANAQQSAGADHAVANGVPVILGIRFSVPERHGHALSR
jgi:hypothetical protein